MERNTFNLFIEHDKKEFVPPCPFNGDEFQQLHRDSLARVDLLDIGQLIYNPRKSRDEMLVTIINNAIKPFIHKLDNDKKKRYLISSLLEELKVLIAHRASYDGDAEVLKWASPIPDHQCLSNVINANHPELIDYIVSSQRAIKDAFKLAGAEYSSFVTHKDLVDAIAHCDEQTVIKLIDLCNDYIKEDLIDMATFMSKSQVVAHLK